jgi:hypothetical protein
MELPAGKEKGSREKLVHEVRGRIVTGEGQMARQESIQ